jgi:hypothetical protein
VTDETSAAVEYLERRYENTSRSERYNPSDRDLISLIDDHDCSCEESVSFRVSESVALIFGSDEEARYRLRAYYGVSDLELDNPPRWIA